MESLSFVAPVAYTLDWLIFFSDTSKRADAGHRQPRWAWCSARRRWRWPARSFRWEGFARHRGHRQPPGRRGADGRRRRHRAWAAPIGQGLSGCRRWRWAASSRWPASWPAACSALRYQAWRVERSRERAPPALRRRPRAPLRRPAPAVRRRRLRAAARRARGRGRPRRRRLVGGRGAGAQRRGGAGADRPRPRRRVATSTARCRRWAARSARPRRWRCASASPTSTRAARCRRSRSSSTRDNWPALLPHAGGRASSTPATRCAPRRRWPPGRCASGVPFVCVGAAGGKRHAQRVEVEDLAARHARPAAGRAAPAPAPASTAPRAQGRIGAALRVLARGRGGAGRRPATPSARSTAASTATATARASP